MNKALIFTFLLCIMLVPLVSAQDIGGSTAGFGVGVSSELADDGTILTTMDIGRDVSLGNVLTVRTRLWVAGTEVTPGGSGTITSATANEITYYTGATTVDGNTALVTTAAGDLSANGDMTVQGDIYVAGDILKFSNMTYSANQTTNFAAGDELAFDGQPFGNLDYDTSTHRTMLIPGRTYRCFVSIFIGAPSTTAAMQVQCHNATDDVFFGSQMNTSSLDTLGKNSVQISCVGYITPTVDTEVDFEILYNGDTGTIHALYSYAEIISMD